MTHDNSAKLTYPAPHRDWQHGHSVPWTPARRAEYATLGGWFPSPLPTAYNFVSQAKDLAMEEAYITRELTSRGMLGHSD